MVRSRPLVSVVIAAFNSRGFVGNAVRSAFEQDYPSLEVIVSDDASTDGTPEEVSKMASDDPRIRLICSDVNLGPSAARNRGFAAAAGEWIAVLDADDELKAGRLTTLVSAAESANVDAVVDGVLFRSQVGSSDALSIGFQDASAGPRLIDFLEFLDRARPLTGQMDWGLLKPIFRSSFIKTSSIRYPETSRHGEDFLLLVDLFLASGRLLMVPPAGYIYTLRNEETSRTAVNYGAMRHQSRALLADARLRDHQQARRLLKRRVRAIAIHEGGLRLDALRRSGDHIALMVALATDPKIAAAAVWRARGKLAG